MSLSCYRQIQDYMLSKPRGTVYAAIDFKDFGSADAIRKSLSRLTKIGVCKRILPGIFHCPFYSTLLKKEVFPSSCDVAYALARNYGWSIVPSPIHAQNDLGISTQVPAQVIYTSTGPTRKYIVNDIPIEFKQSRSKYMNRMSYKSALVTNALRDLKIFGINDDVVNIVSSRLSVDEKKALQDELHFAPVWLQPHLKEIVSM